MPTYLYECKNHGEFEIDQKMSDPPLEKCPKCEKENVESEKPKRLISKSSFILMGGGVGWASNKYSGK